MEFLIIVGTALVIGLVLRILFDFDLGKIKALAQEEELDKIIQRYPDNKQVAQEILAQLNNTEVVIEEKDTQSSLYIAVSNKILIGNIQKSYTRIQTIAHECLHSIQSRKLQLFHFALSNIYLLYFISIAILGIFKVLPFRMTFLVIFILVAMLFYVIRTYLENDAMIKAPFLAKEYLEKQQLSSQEEIEKVLKGYEKLNKIGIKAVNYKLFISIIFKVVILSVIFYVFQ